MKKALLVFLLVFGAATCGLFAAFVVREVVGARKQHEGQLAEGQRKLSRMLAFSADDVANIVIYDRYGRETWATVENKKDVSNFLQNISGLTDWSPNHPSFDRSYYVILNSVGSEKFEFEMHLKASSDPTVYIHQVRKEGNSTYYLGRKKSKTLKAWLDSCFEPR